MTQKSTSKKTSAKQSAQDIRRKKRKQYSAEEKICIVLEGLLREESISSLCRREGIAYSCVKVLRLQHRLYRGAVMGT